MNTNAMKTCLICVKTMRRDHLKTHMKSHICQIEEFDDEDINEISVKYSSSNFEKLEKFVLSENSKFERKIVLGRKLKIIIENHDVNTDSLPQNMKDALVTYDLYGKKMDMNMQEINWNGWQKDLIQYINFASSNMKIIWVVGSRGNEGKSFIQWNILEELGYSKVNYFGRQSRNKFHILGKLSSTNNDIYLFNVERDQYPYSEQYTILESIKNGTCIHNEEVFNLKKPNVFIVFANIEPDRDELSEDMWLILNISQDFTSLKEITDDGSIVKSKRKKMTIQSDKKEMM